MGEKKLEKWINIGDFYVVPSEIIGIDSSDSKSLTLIFRGGAIHSVKMDGSKLAALKERLLPRNVETVNVEEDVPVVKKARAVQFSIDR